MEGQAQKRKQVERTEEGTGGKDGDDERFALGREARGAVILGYVAERL